MSEHNEKIGMRGHYRITLADVSSAAAQALCKKIEQLKQLGDMAGHLEAIRELNRRFAIVVESTPNVVCNAGKGVICRQLAGNTTYTMPINYFAVGTSNTAAAATDTQLGVETYRNLIASLSYLANVFYCTGFINQTEYPGVGTVVLKEVGVFMAGTGAANSGQILSHTVISNFSKTYATTTMTVDFSFTIN